MGIYFFNTCTLNKTALHVEGSFINDYEASNGKISIAGAKLQTKVVQNNLDGVNNLAVNGNVYNK